MRDDQVEQWFRSRQYFLDGIAMLDRTTFEESIEELDEVLPRMEISGSLASTQKSK